MVDSLQLKEYILSGLHCTLYSTQIVLNRLNNILGG